MALYLLLLIADLPFFGDIELLSLFIFLISDFLAVASVYVSYTQGSAGPSLPCNEKGRSASVVLGCPYLYIYMVPLEVIPRTVLQCVSLEEWCFLICAVADNCIQFDIKANTAC